MRTFALPPGQTWRKLGYLLYGNSLEYRKVMGDNPGWGIDQFPPHGSFIYYSGSKTAGSFNNGAPANISQESQIKSRDLYPYRSEEKYAEALNKYSPLALMTVEETNGYTIDSTPAISGLQ